MRPRFLLLLILLVFVMPLCGCDADDNPFQRKQVAPENNTPQWRYYHSYKMYLHEHTVLEKYLESGSRSKVRNSWPRLREYLLGMKENMPEEMAFEFLVVIDEYDSALNLYIKKNKSSSGAYSKITRKRFMIEKKYKPEKVYPLEDPKKEPEKQPKNSLKNVFEFSENILLS